MVAIDNRNHGSSDKPNLRGAGRAEDVIELMDYLKISKGHIHGYSMAFTAQLLSQHPKRVLTASFGGSGISETDPGLRAKAAAMDRPMPEPQGAEADAFKNLRDSAAKAASAGASVPGPGSSPLVIDLKKVKIPVFAINGEFDSPHAKNREDDA